MSIPVRSEQVQKLDPLYNGIKIISPINFSSPGNLTLDMQQAQVGVFDVTVNANISKILPPSNLPNPLTLGEQLSFMLILRKPLDTTTISFGTDWVIKWANSLVPNFAATPNTIDVFTFLLLPTGTTTFETLGFPSARNMG